MNHQYSTRKQQFDRAFRGFVDAHARGMRSLNERDFRALHEAVADECAALEAAYEAITDLPRVLDPTVEASDGGGADPSIVAERLRLFDQMHALEREHDDLETRPGDLGGHREHRAKLHAHIADLKVHLERLRAHAPSQPRT